MRPCGLPGSDRSVFSSVKQHWHAAIIDFALENEDIGRDVGEYVKKIAGMRDP